MGKNLENSKLIQRTGKLAFYKSPRWGTSGVQFPYKRMEAFTSLSTSKNPKEYSRQYVDEDFERTDIIGYATSIGYAFDKYKGNAVLDDIVEISDNEYIGDDSVVDIVSVDMTTAQLVSGALYKADAIMRKYSVIPDAEGDSTDCLTYSGTFKTRGEKTKVTVYTETDWTSIRTENVIPDTTLASLGLMGITLSPSFSSAVTEYTASTSESTATLIAYASDPAAMTVIRMANGNVISTSDINLSAGTNTINAIVTNGTNSTTYTITVTKS